MVPLVAVDLLVLTSIGNMTAESLLKNMIYPSLNQHSKCEISLGDKKLREEVIALLKEKGFTVEVKKELLRISFK